MDYCTFNEVLTLTTIVDPCGFYRFCCCCFLLEWNNKCPGTWYAVVDLEFFFLLDMKSHQSSLLSGLRTSNILSNAHQPSKPLSYSSNHETWSPLYSIRYHIGMFSWWYHVLIQPGEQEVATIPRLTWHIYGNISTNSKSYITKSNTGDLSMVSVVSNMSRYIS